MYCMVTQPTLRPKFLTQCSITLKKWTKEIGQSSFFPREAFSRIRTGCFQIYLLFLTQSLTSASHSFSSLGPSLLPSKHLIPAPSSTLSTEIRKANSHKVLVDKTRPHILATLVWLTAFERGMRLESIEKSFGKYMYRLFGVGFASNVRENFVHRRSSLGSRGLFLLTGISMFRLVKKNVSSSLCKHFCLCFDFHF